MNDIKFLRVEFDEIAKGITNRKLRYQVRYLEIRLMQLNLRIKYVNEMKNRTKLHVRLKQDAIDFMISQLKFAKGIIKVDDDKKKADRQKQLDYREKELKDKQKTVKEIQEQLKKDIRSGSLSRISMNQKKIQTYNEQIQKL